MSYCELCGAQITGKPIPIVVENDVVMQVCGPCSKHGRQHPSKKKIEKRWERRERRQPRQAFTIKLMSVRKDYSKLIKEARERLGMTEDELGEKMGELGPVVKLMEVGKFKPDEALARRLEGVLGVTLLEEEVHE